MHVMAQTHPMSHIEDMHDMDRTWNPEIVDMQNHGLDMSYTLWHMAQM
jgi:hypothetical protein